jgi:hypothetical protein
MITKIISGGQTGADQAGLAAAKCSGLETGGWMPKNFLTQNGNRPDFKTLYGIQEHPDPSYHPRTLCNVQDSDGTIRFAGNFESPGEILTLKGIQLYHKPHIDVDVTDMSTSPEDVLRWTAEYEIHILNVAGNTEKNYPGIHDFTFTFLMKLFSLQNNLLIENGIE